MQFSYDQENIYLINNDSTIAKANFTIKDNILSINHIIVEEQYRGKGIAKQLMLEVIKYSEKNNLLINPICEYAKMFFKHNSKYNHLLID